MQRLFFFLLGLLFCCSGCEQSGNRMKIIGHRGAMGYETENTLASVDKALELGVDMIQIDVFRIRSGELVVFHDPQVDRLTNGNGAVQSFNLLDLKSLLLDGNHRIPTLQEVLQHVDRRCRVNIEMQGEGVAETLDSVLDYHIEKKGWRPGEFLVSGEDRHELGGFRMQNPEIPLAVVAGDDLPEVLKTATGIDASAIIAEYSVLTREDVDRIHKAGFLVFCRTVNTRSTADQLHKMGVDGVLTDYPDRVN
ncbi:glycerophosphodiester phosphodiesterase [Sinomicrobium oceani]|uniref:glycerophosphodiester phosphodiesterase n=1 Tax=Sinomicrobium oceani TaxID=1150368 RepID=UPI00227B2E33|nr:glycerophosphodiester phosphodiesterase [Sinomicrobium oceani]